MSCHIRNIFASTILLLLFAFIAPHGAFAETAPTNKIDLGIQFRTALIQNDHGLEHELPSNPSRTTTVINTSAVNLTLKANLGDYAKVDAAYYLLDGELQWGYIESEVLPNLKIKAGRDYLHEGGYQQSLNRYDAMIVSPYVVNGAALGGRGDLLEIIYETFVQLSLQATNDVVATSLVGETPTQENLRFNQRSTKPALLYQILAPLGPVQFLAQFCEYDLSNSKALTFGLHLDLPMLQLYIDYTDDERLLRQTIGSALAYTYSQSSLSSRLEYLWDEIRFGLEYHDFDVTESAAVSTDVNEAATADADLFASDNLNDNANIVGIWAQWRPTDSALRPYLSLVQRSGRFMHQTEGTEEERQQTVVSVGVFGTL